MKHAARWNDPGSVVPISAIVVAYYQLAQSIIRLGNITEVEVYISLNRLVAWLGSAYWISATALPFC